MRNSLLDLNHKERLLVFLGLLFGVVHVVRIVRTLNDRVRGHVHLLPQREGTCWELEVALFVFPCARNAMIRLAWALLRILHDSSPVRVDV